MPSRIFCEGCSALVNALITNGSPFWIKRTGVGCLRSSKATVAKSLQVACYKAITNAI
jgi:hypothetical protein